MKKSVFEFNQYPAFLSAWILDQPRKGHGLRTKMAEALGRQNVFLSQVLHGDAHLTLTQAQTLTEWMGLSEAETHFFLLLVQHARADSAKLQAYFQKQIEAIREKNQQIRHRLEGKAEAIPEKDRLRYYSAWYYGAIRILTAIPGFQGKNEIARRLSLPLELVTNVLEFLTELGLVMREGDRYKISSKDIFLGNDSALVSRHHTNWRLRLMQSLERERKEELHYSTAVVISEKDAEKIKRQLLDAIEANRKLVADSGTEELYCVCVDFFRA